MSALLGAAALPAVLFWEWHRRWPVEPGAVRVVVLAMSLVPAYILFAVVLLVLSAVVARLLGWRTRAGAALRIASLDWPLLDWARYLVLTHVVRVLVGTVFRATPLWTWYLRLNGATVGRGVFVNSLGLMDHCLIVLGDGVVVGSDVHLSGHTVEAGVVRTAEVRLGARVTVGVGSVVGIGVEAGDGCQIGALSYVPKFARLEAGGLYGGVPVRRLDAAPPPS